MAEGHIKHPAKLSFTTGNSEANWKLFKQQLETFLYAIEKHNAATETKWGILMSEAGVEAFTVYNSMKSTLITTTPGVDGQPDVVVDNSKNYDSVVAMFDTYATQNKSVTYCRELFNNRNQKEKEPFANWFTDLQNLVQSCDYRDITDSMLKDRIIWGAYHMRIKATLRSKPNLTLPEMVELVKTLESLTPEEQIVDFIQSHGRKPPPRGPIGSSRGRVATNEAVKKRLGYKPHHQRQDERKAKKNLTYDCFKCGTHHGPRSCPAYGTICRKCQKYNHYAAHCPTSGDRVQGRFPRKTTKQVDALEAGPSSADDYVLDGWDEADVDQIEVAEDDMDEWFENLQLEGEHYIKFKLDPGSDVDIIPYSIFQSFNGKYPMKPKNVVIKSYGQVKSSIEGAVTLSTATKYGTRKQCEFLVSKLNDKPILGRHSCVKLNLVHRVQHPMPTVNQITTNTVMPATKEEFVQKYKALFEGRGQFRKTVTIPIDPTAPASACAPRRYNLSITERLKTQLEQLVAEGVIAKVTNELPTFVSNLVIREKPNGDLRLCLDPAQLNKAIINSKYPIPTWEELSFKLRDKKYFTVLDLKDGFWHAQLDDQSSLLCSFTTPYGIYKFLKMPFGISCAPEIFQFLNDQVFSDTGACIYFDDCLVAGRTLEEHDMILQKVLERARLEPIRFNPSKLQYRTEQVMFLGFLWSCNKIEIDPERTEAIQALKRPEKKLELQKVMGTFNHLRKFIPQMATISKPLCTLLSNKTPFLWLPEHETAFQQLKDSICTAPALAPFDIRLPIIVQADASQFGLGACLMQNGQLVSSASRKLTEHEDKWAQIEKEMLALSYAASKFDNMIYGMAKLTFQTDHQPLVSIFKKPIYKITNNRLKKLRIRMMRYPNAVVEYLPGKHMHLADLLSRSYMDGPVEDDPEMMEIVHEVTAHLPMSDLIRQEFVTETARDKGLQAVQQYYQNGWPRTIKSVPPEAQQYWKIRHDVFTEGGLVVLEDRIIVPVRLRSKVLRKLHSPHLGIDKTKNRARQFLYWPGMSNEIANLILSCRICERHHPNNVKEPLLPHAIPKYPYQKVSLDILEYKSCPYLVVIDNLSKWIELKQLNGKSSSDVIAVLREIFSTHGVPEILFGDNNPLNSFECHEYAKSIGSSIVTSSPGYARSNGLAEKGVHICKQLLTKCEEDGIHYLDALRDYNNTPQSGTNITPAQVLMSRHCRTNLPMLPKHLQPKVVQVRSLYRKQQAKVKAHHDLTARKGLARTFRPGDRVVYRRGSQWEKATVVRAHSTPRSYIIRLMNGRLLRRNISHMKLSRTTPDKYDVTVAPYDIELLPCSQAPDAHCAERPQMVQPDRGPEAQVEEDEVHHPGVEDPGSPPRQVLAPRGRGPRRGPRARGVNIGRVTRSGREVRLPVWRRDGVE